MSGQEHENIKSLLESVPAGFLVDSAWLERQGIGRRSAYGYVKRGWLERVHRGVFRRPSPNATKANTLDWKTCLLSMQHIMGYDVHVGGTTALSQQGYVCGTRLSAAGLVADLPRDFKTDGSAGLYRGRQR